MYEKLNDQNYRNGFVTNESNSRLNCFVSAWTDLRRFEAHEESIVLELWIGHRSSVIQKSAN